MCVSCVGEHAQGFIQILKIVQQKVSLAPDSLIHGLIVRKGTLNPPNETVNSVLASGWNHPLIPSVYILSRLVGTQATKRKLH